MLKKACEVCFETSFPLEGYPYVGTTHCDYYQETAQICQWKQRWVDSGTGTGGSGGNGGTGGTGNPGNPGNGDNPPPIKVEPNTGRAEFNDALNYLLQVLDGKRIADCLQRLLNEGKLTFMPNRRLWTAAAVDFYSSSDGSITFYINNAKTVNWNEMSFQLMSLHEMNHIDRFMEGHSEKPDNWDEMSQHRKQVYADEINTADHSDQLTNPEYVEYLRTAFPDYDEYEIQMLKYYGVTDSREFNSLSHGRREEILRFFEDEEIIIPNN